MKMNRVLQKGLLCVALSAISASAFAAQTFTITRSNYSGFAITHAAGGGGSISFNALPSANALPTVNDILTLRGAGFGDGAAARSFPLLSLPPLAVEQVNLTNGGKGNFSTFGLDTALLAQGRGN